VDDHQKSIFKKLAEAIFYLAVGAIWAGILRRIVSLDDGVDFLILSVVALVALVFMILL
jgi:hypothetical protein